MRRDKSRAYHVRRRAANATHQAHVPGMPDERVPVVLGPRASGKTTRLVRMSAEMGHRILCRDMNAKRAALALAERLGLRIPEPVTTPEMRMERRGLTRHGRPGQVLVDDAELVLAEMLGPGIDVTGMSVTGEERHEEHVWERVAVTDRLRVGDRLRHEGARLTVIDVADQHRHVLRNAATGETSSCSLWYMNGQGYEVARPKR